jgi:hypothetical protein
MTTNMIRTNRLSIILSLRWGMCRGNCCVPKRKDRAMSMGYKNCMHCSGEAEALYAVDGMIEYYCPECQMQWAEEPTPIYQSPLQTWLLDKYGEA